MHAEPSNAARPITVEIERYNPDTGESWRQKYEVPLESGWSVLNVLNWIYENQDPTLAYYYSCRIGKCEGCDCVVNGRKMLICNTLAEGDMVLEPLPEFQVYKDLLPNRSKARVSVSGRRKLRI